METVLRKGILTVGEETLPSTLCGWGDVLLSNTDFPLNVQTGWNKKVFIFGSATAPPLSPTVNGFLSVLSSNYTSEYSIARGHLNQVEKPRGRPRVCMYM